MDDSKTSAEVCDYVFGCFSKQQRARATRKQLVDAAREIFARDGFELARLEDIAAAAGKTRGAFYAHFRDKEDVFFAIFEENMAHDQERITPSLSAATTRQERVEVLVQHLAALLNDRRRMLLNLEFKAYAIRHPHRQKRLADLVSAMCLCCAETGIDYLVPELRHKDDAIKHAQAAQFGALIDGLAINKLFDPNSLAPERVLQYLRAGVESILDSSPPETSSDREKPPANSL
ncbi:MAG: TetR/AcrR family transcriptional regulator [Terracidiphilus sp.]|nr:TetR/AcrR family transcriptional regulator [Terracidiphilus sp.]MDR3775272.1 TetR/AcrR family transcriptional regulator [Terracidiphilus sp.]